MFHPLQHLAFHPFALFAITHSNHSSFPGSKASQLQSEITKQRNADNSNSQQTPDTTPSSNAAAQVSPQTQSQKNREANLAEAAGTISTKMDTDPSSITKEDGDLLHSREVRAHGSSEKGGLASQAQSQAAENMGATKGASGVGSGDAGAISQVSPATQSQRDREANLADAAAQIGGKMQTDPDSVTKEDGDLLHSRETKAKGRTEKGGLASQVQSQAAENMGVKK